MGNTGSGEADAEFVPQPTGGSGPEIILNVYVPTQDAKPGVYHSGIQIGSVEYAYGGGSVAETGVYKQTPQEDPSGGNWTYSRSLRLGKAKVQLKDVDSKIRELESKFPANEYDVVRKNCNHFTEAVSKVLGVHINYPSWVNSLARTGARFGFGEGKSVEVEEAKTVFESTKGHSLNDEKTQQEVKDLPLDRNGRPNPWLLKKK